MSYRIVFARSARRELQDLPRVVVNRVFPKIEALAVEPRPSGSIKLRGSVDLWRLRVGDYRVIYRIDDDQQLVDIVAVRHRGEAYR